MESLGVLFGLAYVFFGHLIPRNRMRYSIKLGLHNQLEGFPHVFRDFAFANNNDDRGNARLTSFAC